jgi:uncharacterized membrane protein
MEEQPRPPHYTISKSRLEFLFDGIFAIAMTILVLELRVPELADRHSVAELARALAHDAPTFGSYLLSFLMLGVFWYRHNHQYRHLEFVSKTMLALHLVGLAAAAFFPFCAGLLGRYPTNALSVVVYLGCVMVYFWASFANWLAASRAGAISPEMPEAEYRRARRRALRSCMVVSVLFALNLFRILAG